MTHLKQKAQIAMEFFMLIAFLFVVCVALIVAAGWQMEQFSSQKDSQLVDDLGSSLKAELDTASVVSDGYTRTLVIPNLIDDRIDFNITANSSELFISTAKNTFSYAIPAVNGSIGKGNNTLTKINGTVWIKNG